MGHALEILQKCFIVGWCWLMVAGYTVILSCLPIVVMLLSCDLGDPIKHQVASIKHQCPWSTFLIVTPCAFLVSCALFQFGPQGGKKVVELGPKTHPSCGKVGQMPGDATMFFFSCLTVCNHSGLIPSWSSNQTICWVAIWLNLYCCMPCVFKASIQNTWSRDRFFP